MTPKPVPGTRSLAYFCILSAFCMRAFVARLYAFRCVKIMAAEHRYKLLAGEKPKQTKRPRESEGHTPGTGDEPDNKQPRPKSVPKQKAKAKTAAKARS